MTSDPLRLALGTFTAIPVPPPRSVDRRVAGTAMLLGPFVGALLAVVGAGVILVVRLSPLGHTTHVAVTLLACTLAVLTVAVLTRALHLDGLADSFDALGVQGSGEGVVERRLAVMREPGIGAFGAVALVLTIAVQILALTSDDLRGRGTVSLVAALVVARLSLAWACRPGVPAARPDGLGATVAGSVPRVGLVAETLLALALMVWLGYGDDDGGRRLAFSLVVAGALGLVVGTLMVHLARRLLGGITGDVLGAVVEVVATTVLLALALLP